MVGVEIDYWGGLVVVDLQVLVYCFWVVIGVVLFFGVVGDVVDQQFGGYIQLYYCVQWLVDFGQQVIYCIGLGYVVWVVIEDEVFGDISLGQV